MRGAKRHQATQIFYVIVFRHRQAKHRSRQLELPASVEPLVLGVRRLLWMHSRILVMLLGKANDAFGNNTA